MCNDEADDTVCTPVAVETCTSSTCMAVAAAVRDTAPMRGGFVPPRGPVPLCDRVVPPSTSPPAAAVADDIIDDDADAVAPVHVHALRPAVIGRSGEGWGNE